jgi:hypothetical protein
MRKLLTILALLLVFTTPIHANDGRPPSVKIVYPADGESDVPVATTIRFIMEDPDGVATQSVRVHLFTGCDRPNCFSSHPCGDEISGELVVLDYEGCDEVVTFGFFRNGSFSEGKIYYFQIDAWFHDYDGNGYPYDVFWQFRIEGGEFVLERVSWGEMKTLSP